MLDLVVSGGHVVSGLGVQKTDLGIKNGKIAVISGWDSNLESVQTIDVRGKIVIPGVIDAHLHFTTPQADTADTAETASIAGAYGGVTTYLAFLHPAVRVSRRTMGSRAPYWAFKMSEKPLDELLWSYIQEVESTSVLDFGAHMYIFPEPTLISQIPLAIKVGINSFKLLLNSTPKRGMLLDDYLVMSVLDTAANNDGMTMIHAESGYVVMYLGDKFAAQGKYTPENYLKLRPSLIEVEAVQRLITLAEITNCPLYVVHLNTKEGLENAIRAKSKGRNVTVETCPHYLLLTHEDMLEKPLLRKFTPPLRPSDDVDALWLGLKQGFIEVVASDHDALLRPKAGIGKALDFHEMPSHFTSTEELLPLLYSEGVRKGRIDLPCMVRLLCENPAKIFGLYPKKGSVSIGADADLVVIDPKIEWTLTAEEIHSKAGYTVYEGRKVVGKPIMSLLRGEILLKDGVLHQQPGFGRYIPRPVSGSK